MQAYEYKIVPATLPRLYNGKLNMAYLQELGKEGWLINNYIFDKDKRDEVGKERPDGRDGTLCFILVRPLDQNRPAPPTPR